MALKVGVNDGDVCEAQYLIVRGGTCIAVDDSGSFGFCYDTTPV